MRASKWNYALNIESVKVEYARLEGTLYLSGKKTEVK